MAGENENVDRGDDFIPTEDAEDAAAKEAREAEENAKVAGKLIDKAADKIVEKVEKDDAEKTDEEKAAEEKAAEDKKVEEKKPEPRMPLSRHREILNREREAREAAEARLAKAEKTGTASQLDADIAKDETKIDELETAYSKQLADGDVKEAGATMKAIRLLERSINDRKSDARIADATDKATEAVRYDGVVERLEKAYPQLEHGNDKYDQPKVNEVRELMAGFVAQGYKPSAALQKAVGYVFPAQTARQEEAVDVTTDAKPDAGKTADELKAERKTAAVLKAASTAGKQPPDLKTVGIDSDKAGASILKGVMKMSQEDFAKLDEKELARMRGDELA